MSQSSTEQSLAVVLATMNDLAKGLGGSYVADRDIAERTGIALEEVRDYMDILEERGLTQSANAAERYCAQLTAKARMSLRDPNFKTDNRISTVVVQGNAGVFVNINSTLNSVNQSITTSPYFQADKEKISDLIEQLNEALKSVPPENAEDAEAVAETAKVLVEYANKEKPNRALLSISAEGLKKAAQNLATITPTVLTISHELVKALAG